MDSERRQGALETAHALGELSAQIAGLVRRMDDAAANLIRTTTDQQSQLHEVKHAYAQQATILTSFDERLKSHNAAVQENRERSAENIRMTRESLTAELLELKQTASRTESKLEDLMLWRNRILGALAIVGVSIAVFGDHIGAWVMKMFANK